MTQPVRIQVLKLYKNLLREASCMAAYNFRMYAVRRIKYGFKENKQVTDQQQINKFITEGTKNLVMLRRQVIISNLYATDKLIIEQDEKK